MKAIGSLLLLAVSLGVAQARTGPHILLVVADDLGFSDPGCFGGEMDTPALDRLAADGVRFSRFRVNPMCVVTRTSLLTGHVHSQSDGYRRSVPIARLLQQAGYATSISGKWHQPGHPMDAGFDAFYGFLEGEIDSWAGTLPHASTPVIRTDRGDPVPVEQGWYSSDAFTDHALAQIDAAVAADKPFFAFLAFNAPHGPIHAPKANVEKYLGRYDQGWKALRNARYKRMREMGLIDERFRMVEPDADVRRWRELAPETKTLESRRMAAYAGMVDRMDENIGRLLEHLGRTGVLDQTVVLFFSDNGGDYGHGDSAAFEHEIPWQPGGARPATANGWASLKCAPFRWYKSCAAEGGVASPLIVRWPGNLASPPGSILHHRLHVTDLYPTFLALAGVTYPETRGIEPLYGRSMLPLWQDPTLDRYAIHDEIFWEHADIGKGFLRGDWKISSINDSPWMLFNLAEDPAESIDLAAQNQERLQSLADGWEGFAQTRTIQKPGWNMPLRETPQGWGMHRLKMVLPVRSIDPACSATNVPRNTALRIDVAGDISFAQTDNKTLRLYAAGDRTHPVWTVDPEPGHPAEGTRSVVFLDLPALQADTTYFAISDPGWIRVGGEPAGPINDGAFWYRFRTAPVHKPNSTRE